VSVRRVSWACQLDVSVGRASWACQSKQLTCPSSKRRQPTDTGCAFPCSKQKAWPQPAQLIRFDGVCHRPRMGSRRQTLAHCGLPGRHRVVSTGHRAFSAA
jgi:hypothetical protein